MQSEPQSPPIAMITGVTGQDGCYLAAHLIKHGYKIVGTTRQISTDRLWGLKQLGICNKITLESLCLDSVEQIEKLIDDYTPTMIFHLAGQSSPHLSFSLPKETFESIAGSTQRLLEALQKATTPSRLFVAGSCAMFGNSHQQPVTCRSRCHPSNPYAVAKEVAFRTVRDFRDRHGLFACTGVLFNHESPLRPKHFVTQKIIAGACSIKIGQQKNLHLGDLSIKRDWGWAPEYVVAMNKMLTRKQPEDFLIATGKQTPLHEFVSKTFEAVGLPWQKYVFYDDQFVRSNDGCYPLASVRETTENLGWTATVQLPELIQNMISAYQKNDETNHLTF
jgi:GDPmannose 4,6-dehydratase